MIAYNNLEINISNIQPIPLVQVTYEIVEMIWVTVTLKKDCFLNNCVKVWGLVQTQP